MCLLAFALEMHPQYEFILVANRDEFFERPTLPMHFWESNTNLLAGKDLQENGTWLGLHKNGKFTALTNYRDGFQEQKNAPSRGKLTTHFLEKETLNAKDYVQQIQNIKTGYNGFNLVVSDETGLYYISNYSAEIQKLTKGVHALSNSLLNDFSWQKTAKSKAKLTALLENSEDSTNELELLDKLLGLMTDTNLANDVQLPNTGVPYEWEKGLSSVFISAFPTYGTRCTTAVLRDYSGKITVREVTYDDAQKRLSDLTYYLEN